MTCRKCSLAKKVAIAGTDTYQCTHPLVKLRKYEVERNNKVDYDRVFAVSFMKGSSSAGGWPSAFRGEEVIQCEGNRMYTLHMRTCVGCMYAVENDEGGTVRCEHPSLDGEGSIDAMVTFRDVGAITAPFTVVHGLNRYSHGWPDSYERNDIAFCTGRKLGRTD